MLYGRIKALGYSIEGLIATWKTEVAFRIECILSVVLIPLAIWLGQSGLERAVLVGVVLLVLMVELLNSAIEACIDRIGSDIHPISKLAKDVASAAVLVSLVTVAVVWSLILL